MDFTRNIARSIKSNTTKKTFTVERAGSDVNFAVDESSRFLALLSRKVVSFD
jgi:hypothetical protein